MLTEQQINKGIIMSKLIVEVCKIESVKKHPSADNLDIIQIKGWQTVVKKDEFKPQQKCVFFPPDSILPLTLTNSPEDDPPGRLGITKYLKEMRRDSTGKQLGRRVAAIRLRGVQSFGVIMALDSNHGDNLDWEIGTNVSEHYKVQKYEPPLESLDGDAVVPHPRFYGYTDIENINNYPGAIPDGTEVIMTEKVHGTSSRIGLVLEPDKDGNANWEFMAGSRGMRRREFSFTEAFFQVKNLPINPKVNDIVSLPDKSGKWVIVKKWIPEKKRFNWTYWIKQQIFNWFGFFDPSMILARQLDENNNPVLTKTKYWFPVNDKTKSLLNYIKDEFPWHEPKTSIILYGEIIGSGIQDMAYGFKNGWGYLAFDISINNQYLDRDDQCKLFSRFDISNVPLIYQGPFSQEILEKHTSGPTTVCNPKEAGSFKGREGVVVKPVKESYTETGSRMVFKSVSADYLARKGGTDN